MSSIATKRGDGGQTDLAGGVRVSKASLRVDACGTLDELNSAVGFARSLCDDTTITDLAREIQRELFQVGAALATVPGRTRSRVPITLEMSDHLTNEVHRIEAEEGILSDWSLPGASTPSAAFDVARTVCRRAERLVVRLMESGEEAPDGVLVYLNRLSDLLWLLGHKIERDAGVSGALRDITGRERTC